MKSVAKLQSFGYIFERSFGGLFIHLFQPLQLNSSILMHKYVLTHFLYLHNKINMQMKPLNKSLNVTRPAKTGHVGTNYTLSYYRPYLSIGTEYLHSVTCIINPIKCLLSGKNFIAIAHRY